MGNRLSRLPGDGDHQVSRHPILHLRDADEDRGANVRGTTDGNDNDRRGATDDNKSRLAADHHHCDDRHHEDHHHNDPDDHHDHQSDVEQLLHDGAVF